MDGLREDWAPYWGGPEDTSALGRETDTCCSPGKPSVGGDLGGKRQSLQGVLICTSLLAFSKYRSELDLYKK